LIAAIVGCLTPGSTSNTNVLEYTNV
jgi:hypothetical protein